MSNNNAIIPLYINDKLINNLFTVVVQKFSETKTINTRSQQVVKIATPLANICKGQYVQGTFNVEFLNEFAKQRTQERVSKIIVVFLETRQILQEQNILKKLNTKEQVMNIKENDYIEFTCKLNKSPQLKNTEDIIKYLEMKNSFIQDTKEDNSKLIMNLKDKLTECKTSQCLKFITDGICGTDTKAVVHINMKYFQDDIDYLKNIRITIIGKVINVGNKNDSNIDLSSGTYYDYLNEESIKKFKEKFLRDYPLKCEFSNQIIKEDCPIIEILPIAIYV